MNELASTDSVVENRLLRALGSYSVLLGIASNKLSSRVFSSAVKQKLFSALVDYHINYGSSPSKDLLKANIKNLYVKDDAYPLIIKYANMLYDKIPVPEYNWVVKNLSQLVLKLSLYKAIRDSLSQLKDGDVEGAKNNLSSGIVRGGLLLQNSNNDLELGSKDIEKLALASNALCFRSRITALDHYVQGLYRKELSVILAPTNVGKSWSVVHLAVSALMEAKHVLFITLEMYKDKVISRVLQNISGTYFPRNSNDFKASLNVWKDEKSFGPYSGRSLLNTDRVVNSLYEVRQLGGVLSVKEHASNTFRVSDLRTEIELFIVNHNKEPDVVLIDGLGDMNFSDMEAYNLSAQMAETCRELRALANEFNFSVTITHQANKKGLESTELGVQHSGESFGVMQVADEVWGLLSIREHILSLKVIKSRSQKKGNKFIIKQNLVIGQFHQMSYVDDGSYD